MGRELTDDRINRLGNYETYRILGRVILQDIPAATLMDLSVSSGVVTEGVEGKVICVAEN